MVISAYRWKPTWRVLCLEIRPLIKLLRSIKCHGLLSELVLVTW